MSNISRVNYCTSSGLIFFDSFYERLSSGQISLAASSNAEVGASSGAGGAPSALRKGSGTDSVPSESDSQPVTAGTSLLDVSHRSQQLRLRRRSGSRASLASRTKSLRLTNEQKCGIAVKEINRIETDLTSFRHVSRKETRLGMAGIEERMLRLEEVSKTRSQLIKGMTKAKAKNKDQFDYDAIEACLNVELRSRTRLLDRMALRNGVLRANITAIHARVKRNRSDAEETGPVDVEQLQLESTRHADELRDRNADLSSARAAMASARRRRDTFNAKLKEAAARGHLLRRTIATVEEEAHKLRASLGAISGRLEKLRQINGEMKSACALTDTTVTTPSLDDYIALKVAEVELEKLEKVANRRHELARLKESTARHLRRKRSQSANGVREEAALPEAFLVARGRVVPAGVAFKRARSALPVYRRARM
jgi:hypothetical protein